MFNFTSHTFDTYSKLIQFIEENYYSYALEHIIYNIIIICKYLYLCKSTTARHNNQRVEMLNNCRNNYLY